MRIRLRRAQIVGVSRILVASFAILMLGIQSLVVLNAPAALADDGIDSQAELQAAIADTGQSVIDISGDITTSSQVTINRALTLNGNGHTIAASFVGASGNDAVLLVTAPTVINNLIVEGVGGTALQGIQVYKSSGQLNNTTIRNNDKAGLHANGSAVTVTNITTSGNGTNYGGILLDKGSGVTTNPSVIVNGTSVHTEATRDIWQDNFTLSSQPTWVTDTNNQYASTASIFGRVYRLKPATPTNLRLNGNQPCGYITNVNWITPTWNAVPNAVSYNYKVTLPNGATYGPTNVGNVTSVSGAFGGEGLSTFSVQAVNANGLTSAWATPCAVTYDATAPAVPTLLTPAADALTNDNTFWFDWSDVAGASGYEFQASQSDATDSNGSLTSGVWHGDASGNEPTDSQAWSAGANGTWYWQVRAVDAAGNKSAWTAPRKLTIDTTAPVATISSPANGAGVRGLVQVTGTVNDANPKNSYFSIYDPNGHVIATSLYTDGRTTHTFTWNTNSLAEGDYTIYFETRDKAGNKDGSIASPGASVKKSTVTIDRSNPIVSLSDIATVATGENSVISGSVDDATATAVEIFVDGGSIGTASVAGGAFSFDYALPEGSHQVYVIARDDAGNTTTSEEKTATVTAAPDDEEGTGEGGDGTVIPPAGGTDGATGGETTTTDSDEEEDDDADQPQIFTQPLVFASNGAVLGDQDDTTTDTSNLTGQEVKGTQDTTQNEQQAASAGIAGLAWYWWLLIVAAVAGFIWWLVASRRRRHTDN